MAYTLTVGTQGVNLSVTSIPTAEEQKEIDSLIAPEGFIMAQVLKKVQVLGEYAGQKGEGAKEAKKEDYKPKAEVCPACGNNSVVTHIVKKEGANKGRKFKSCNHKEGEEKCNFFAWVGA